MSTSRPVIILYKLDSLYTFVLLHKPFVLKWYVWQIHKEIGKTKRTRIDERGGHSPFVAVLSAVPLFTQYLQLFALLAVALCCWQQTGFVGNKQLIKKYCLCVLAKTARMGSVMLVVLTAGQRQTLRTCIGDAWLNRWFAANWYIVLWEVTNPQKLASALLRTNVGPVSVVMHRRR